MLLKGFVLLMIVAIFVSLLSALVLLLRNKENNRTGVVTALTWRIGLSFTLFLLLMAGIYFGIIPPTGMR